MKGSQPLLNRLAALYASMPGAYGRASETLTVEFMRLYSQPHRHYHGLAHILECMSEYDRVRGLFEDPRAAEMALLYHDIVYEPYMGCNERLSANKAAFDCSRLRAGTAFQNSVCDMIMATAHSSPLSGDAALVADIDLSILATPWERFSEYEKQIRKEYITVSDRDYVSKRTVVLDGFMRRASIYQTEEFLGRCERAARANIGLSLMRMSKNA